MLPPVDLLRSVDAAVVVFLDLAVSAEKSHGILPVGEVALVILVISIGFGAFCFLYPVISNAINEQFNESKINEYNENTDTLTDAQIQTGIDFLSNLNFIPAN